MTGSGHRVKSVRVGSGWVGSRVKGSDTLPSLVEATFLAHCLHFTLPFTFTENNPLSYQHVVIMTAIGAMGLSTRVVTEWLTAYYSDAVVSCGCSCVCVCVCVCACKAAMVAD